MTLHPGWTFGSKSGDDVMAKIMAFVFAGLVIALTLFNFWRLVR